MTRTSLFVALLTAVVSAVTFSCHKKPSTVIVCTPIDAGAATDAGDAGDAGETDAGDAGDPPDVGFTDDAGVVVVDGGVTFVDGGIVFPDAGSADAGSVNIICQEMELPDAGACRDIPCNTTPECCDGTHCVQNAPPTCLYCDQPAVSDCLTSNPCGSQTQNTCIIIGLDAGTCACPNGPKSVCAPTCLTAGCPDGFICNRVTQLCDPEPCSLGFVCPAWTTCNQNAAGPNHGCEPKSCVDNSDCIGAACINGTCGEFTGTCQY